LRYKANEFAKYVGEHIDFIQKKSGKEVGFLYGEIKSKMIAGESMPIHGVLAYAGVSRNNRLYLPEHLAAGHDRTLPLRVNHSSVMGMEMELHRLPEDVQLQLMRGEAVVVGEVNLTWHPEMLTLTYEGHIDHPFFQKEVDDGLMNVSLGVLFDADAPEVCDVDCYTMIKGAEFEEVSLVYHPGFPVATLKGALEVLMVASKGARPAMLNTYNQASTTEKQEAIMSKKHATEQDMGIGGIDNPVDDTFADGGGGNCPEGSVWDAETRTCKSLNESTTMTSNPVTSPEAPAKVEKEQPQTSESKRVREQDNGGCPEGEHKNDAGDCVAKEAEDKKSDTDTGSEDPGEAVDKDPDKIGETLKRTASASESVWKPNADLKSERRRTEEHLKSIEREEAKRELKKKGEYLQAKELYLKELELNRRIKVAQESSQSRFTVTTEKQDRATEMSILKPAQWFLAVRNEENVQPSHIWHLNKQQIFENYSGRMLRYFDSRGVEFTKPMSAEQRKSTEAITGPPVADFMRIMSEQVLVLPEGKVVTPIRQFCEVKVLPPGTREAFFYDYGAIAFGDITEGVLIGDTTTVTRSSGGATAPRGARVQINYSDIEESPIDLVAANNRSFALESVNDESIAIVRRAYDDDTGSSGDATTRKAQGGGTKDARWVNGNDGSNFTTASDDAGLVSADTLTFAGLLAAKLIIENEGLDPSNLIMYTSPKAINDLIQDPALDSFIGFSRPEIITEGVVERIAGINLVKSSAIADAAAGAVATAKRSVLFIPQVAFGLVTGRDLTMEAQRRNELQTIHMTGTQKIAGFVKSVEATVRVSHA